MTAFDRAWVIVKAVEIDPALRARPFEAYRAVPSHAVDEILSEGLHPRPIGDWYNWEYFDQYDKMGITPESEVIWTFGHRPKYEVGSDNLKQIQEGWTPYGAGAHPLLSARYFADALKTSPLRGLRDEAGHPLYRKYPMSIIGSKRLPGLKGEDPAWADDELIAASRPLISTEMIEPRYLEEVIPVSESGEPVRYLRGGKLPDHIREEWGWDD